MRYLRRVLGVTVLISSVLFPLSVQAQQPIIINYSSYHPQTIFLTSKVINPWIAEVEKVTQGRVKIETLPKTVGTPAGAFDVARDGLADMTIVITGYTPGRFPLAEMGELPFGGDDATAMSPAFERTYRKHFAKADEFKGVEILSIFTISSGHFFTTRRPIKSMEDLKGLKLRSPSATASRVLTLVGAVPILKSFTEARELISTGAIDGSLLLKETLQSGNLLGLLHHGTIIPGGVFNAVLAVAVNADKWKSIPEADRKAVMSVSGEKFAARIGKAYAQADRDAISAATDPKYDLKIENASPALFQGLKKALSPLDSEWIERAKEKGATDPAAALSEYRREAAKPVVASN